MRMTNNVGVWIDHQRAVLVRITDDGETIEEILFADVAARSPGGTQLTTSFTPRDFVAEDKRDRKAMIAFNKYYDKVIDRLKDAEAIVVLGPGEAKGEFVKRFESKKTRGRIRHVETADKMSDRQIAARLREYEGTELPRAQETTKSQKK
jgi:hypothetical protein